MYICILCICMCDRQSHFGKKANSIRQSLSGLIWAGFVKQKTKDGKKQMQKKIRIQSGFLYRTIRETVSIAARREIFSKSYSINRNQIVLSNFWLIWIQTDVRLNPNQSENGKYNLISGWFNQIHKRFLCVVFIKFFF